MSYLKSLVQLLRLSRTRRTNSMMFVLCCIIVTSMLAACGSATAAQKAVNPAPTTAPVHMSTPTPTPTRVPTPTPTPRPTPIVNPTPVVQPTTAPAPAILDLRPASMSIVGHLDCNKNGAYVCFARVISDAGNQSNLSWFAYTNVPGHIVFSPVRGVLATGQSVLVTITVPFNACTAGLFFFQGPANTHTITWAC